MFQVVIFKKSKVFSHQYYLVCLNQIMIRFLTGCGSFVQMSTQRLDSVTKKIYLT